MVHRIADEIETMIVELGVDARLLRLQLDELYGEIDDELDAGDRRLPAARAARPPTRWPRCRRLSDDEVLDLRTAARHAAPRRHRRPRPGGGAEGAAPAPPGAQAAATTRRSRIADHFGGLRRLQRATVDDLMAVDGVDDVTASLDQGDA